MFTGIVEGIGKIKRYLKTQKIEVQFK